MKAFVFEKTGQPSEVLALHEIPLPTPGPDEVLVRIHVAPIQPVDLHVLRGRFGRQPALPATPGIEGMGSIHAVGKSVRGLDIGARVVALDVPGTWQEFLIVPAARVVVVPDAVSDDDAAQSFVNPVTALAMIRLEHRLKPNDWLVQSAAGSTIGRLVLQLAKIDGFHTINLVRRPEQVQEIKDLGGDLVICTGDDDWQDQLQSAGKQIGGIHYAIDCVAGEVGAVITRNLAFGGRTLVYGALSSHRQTDPQALQLPVFAPQLIYKAATVQGWYLYHWLAITPLEETRALLVQALSLLATGELRLPPATHYSIDDIHTALSEAEASGRQGKPLLVLHSPK